MNSKAVFTICARNYLAQALTLKESFLLNNDHCDFFIFLSDLPGIYNLPDDLVLLDSGWIPEFKRMAFKYNVIEFSTSIKPFCISKLFQDGYEKVIYLDPDIFVTGSLEYIFDLLDKKTIVLSPHYCNIQTEYTGSVTEEELLFVGIYNLGFAAIRNNPVGQKISKWWKNRLHSKCYADKIDSLHVDQKWMDFIPAFFPNDVEVTHHMGINPAIWNLHERELVISDDKYFIKNIETNEIYPLLFFHFSGFDPFNASVLNRRHPKYNTSNFPSFKLLFEEYIKKEYKNGYNEYSKISYSFNSFEDGELITPLHRRLFRMIEKNCSDENPFNQNSQLRNLLYKRKLLTNIKSNGFSAYTSDQRSKRYLFEKSLKTILKITKFLIGPKYYLSLIILLNETTRLENQTFLLRR